MRAVVQRVSQARVKIRGEVVGEIRAGFLILLGVGKDDAETDADWLADKIVSLRVFEDQQGKLNLSLEDIKGEILIVSQFTLYGDCRKGRRPGFDSAAAPEMADRLYNYFVQKVKTKGLKVATGKFQAMMDVELTNQGPVTLILDSKKN